MEQQSKWTLNHENHLKFHSIRPFLNRFVWNTSCRTICALFLATSKFVGKTLNQTHIHNHHEFKNIIDESNGRGILSVSNHTSRLDDPLMWNMLNWKQLMNFHRFRWSTAAEDVCFDSRFSSFCMAVGKVIPLNRGSGVYQKTMDFCVDELNNGKWVHIFPEGAINLEQKAKRLKWGVGRLISDTPVTPLVLLIHHIGFERVFPNEGILFPRYGQETSIYVSHPIDFSQEVEKLKSLMKSQDEIRKHLTDIIQQKMAELKVEAELFHQKVYKKEMKS
ncbi:hypothetical protein ACF0H5_015008 [Mactra antiquata]